MEYEYNKTDHRTSITKVQEQPKFRLGKRWDTTQRQKYEKHCSFTHINDQERNSSYTSSYLLMVREKVQNLRQSVSSGFFVLLCLLHSSFEDLKDGQTH